jgi:hypothetical protein
MHPTDLPGVDRRGFLKIGLVGTGLLMGAGMLGALQGCTTHQLATQPDRPLKVLRDKDAIILGAVAPVVLKGALPVDPAARRQAVDSLLIQVDEFLSHSSEYAHGEFEKLFDLLYLAPTRVLMTGVWSRWENASEADIEAFLTGWRDSRFNLFRVGYAQLTQLTSLVYYSDPASWTAGVYPGPPQHVPS